MQSDSLGLQSARRVAFYGGSFDPPHAAHLGVARAAQAALGLDCVLFAPVGAQPLKPAGSAASFEERVAMTHLAITEDPAFALSLADAPQPDGSPNFTFETLQQLKLELGGNTELFCLIGADSFLHLQHWRRAAEIPFLAQLVVAARPGERLDGLEAALPNGISLHQPALFAGRRCAVAVEEYALEDAAGRQSRLYLLPETQMETNSTALREGLREPDGPAWKELPRSVADYIRAHGLYR